MGAVEMSNLLKIIKSYFNSPQYRFEVNSRIGINRILSDKFFLERYYYLKMGKKLNIDSPETFNEKLQWLKHYDQNPIYTKMVDKYEAKKYVGSIIGEEYIIPTFGVYENFDQIDFDNLPDQFVIKCTHDSNGICICRDVKSFNKEIARQKIQRSLKQNYYWASHEWPYKNVEPRIIVEKYMEDKKTPSLVDYKFFCFNGEPKFLYVSQGLENHNTASISFLYLNWTFAPYERSDYKPFEQLPDKPQHYDDMIRIARKLSAGIPFLRVDLYEINGKIYFSELTFSPCGGYIPFKDEEHDLEIGHLLILPREKK